MGRSWKDFCELAHEGKKEQREETGTGPIVAVYFRAACFFLGFESGEKKGGKKVSGAKLAF